jgi:hypothetical protein
MFTTTKYQEDQNSSMTAGRVLRIAPRAAALTIAADPALREPCRLGWTGAAPTLTERADAIDVRYSPAGRLRALSSRRASLTVALNPAIAWTIELRGGVSGLRADLGGLRVAGLAIAGGATDLEVDLPAGELALDVDGGVNRALVRRPLGVAVSVRIDGGVRDLRLDDTRYGAMSRVLLERSGGGAPAIALHVRGGARGLTVAEYAE